MQKASKKKKPAKSASMSAEGRRRAAWAGAAFVAVPVLAAGARVVLLGTPVVPEPESPLWVLEGKFSVAGGDTEGSAVLHVPAEEPGQDVIEENVLSLGREYRFREAAGNRLLDVKVKPRDSLKIYYRAGVRLGERVPVEARGEAPEKFLKVRDRTPKEVETLDRIAAEIPGEPGSVEAARAVAEYVRAKVTVENARPGRTLATLLKKGAANPADRNDLHIDLSRAKGIPTRRVTGVLPGSSGRVEPVAWVEHLVGGKWHMSMPDRGLFGSFRDGPIVLYRGEMPVAHGWAVNRAAATFRLWRDVYAQQEDPGVERAGLFKVLSLYRLPAETQRFVKLLLLVPLAALLVVLFRMVARGETVGTFLPVILALSFRSTDLVPGLVMLTAVVAIGMAALLVFRRLGLPRVPSAALMVTVIVVALAYLALAGEVFDLYRLGYIVFFPVVIMTLLAERIAHRFLDEGPWATAKIYLGTAGVAAASYLIMTRTYLQNLFMRFPELLVSVMGLIVLTAVWAERIRHEAGGKRHEGGAGTTHEASGMSGQ
ncbi:MAG: UUP1 family membrane protein [Deltaproteobacteria bacterium]|nr:UUP1 family membrane protein [Deltaproteobacteria bacterium]